MKRQSGIISEGNAGSGVYMLRKRIISSGILIGIILATISVDWLAGLVITVFILGGLYEFFTMLEKKGLSIYKYFGMGIGALIPLSILLRFELTKTWELLLVVLALLILILLQFRRRDNNGVIIGISVTVFGILYIAWFLSFLIKIRYLSGGTGLLGAVLIITKMGDIGAYLVGTRFGKTPLMPRVSPNKSTEGSIGGLVFSVLAALACRTFLDFGFLHLIFLGIFLGVLAQLGDLSESLMKRDCQIKDSGNIFPGMGGFLDLIDSLLFTAPAFYFYMSIIFK
ncbi:MAG: phosphatidate cytidylyltransferase [Candidatus Omnitrophica bacterium]|nr:phosphatidate cytidylyltransferase [Candidatus Omnitrophota bacterium]